MEPLAVLIITEIMYNPASDEKPPAATEWVEIYNPTEAEVDVSGWHLADEDGRTGPIATGTKLGAKQALVLIPSECTPEAFAAAWGDGVKVAPLTDWGGRPGLSGLGNNPSPTNEKLALKRADDSISDLVHYDDEGDWPSDETDGPSIYLLPTPGTFSADGNDQGKAWARSRTGTHGAKACNGGEVFDTRDVGSPGVVVAE